MKAYTCCNKQFTYAQDSGTNGVLFLVQSLMSQSACVRTTERSKQDNSDTYTTSYFPIVNLPVL